MATRDYAGVGITIHWDSERCIHSERCFRGAPTVFDPQARPWANPDGAEPAEVARVIDTCPSGALSYTRTDGGANGRRGRAADEDPTASTAPDPDAAAPRPAPTDEAPHPGRPDADPGAHAVTVTPRADGPLVVDGPVGLTRPDGTVEPVRRLFLCRCGQSAEKPNCDGSHKRVGFSAPGVPVARKPDRP